MFRNHRLSNYTGLSCTFSYFIREHGVQPIYDIVLDAARDCSSADHNLSDALASLAIAINSAGVKSAAEGMPRVKKAWHQKTEARLKVWDAVLQAADNISYKKLEFFQLLEVNQLPFGLPQNYPLIIPEPVKKVDEQLEKFSKRLDEDYSWYPFEKFVMSEFPSLIESQIEHYDNLVSRLQDAKGEPSTYPFSILKVRKGSVYQIAELSRHYENARAELPKLKAVLKEYEKALQAELNDGRHWDNVRFEIEKHLPDQLGHVIKYETIKAIEAKADSMTK